VRKTVTTPTEIDDCELLDVSEDERSRLEKLLNFGCDDVGVVYAKGEV
jgi:hypothetical protein